MKESEKQIIKKCNIIIEKSHIDDFIKCFIQEYMNHHLSHINRNYDIDPYGEENWDEGDINGNEFDLESLLSSVEILTKLNLKNKRLFIVDETLKESWTKFNIHNNVISYLYKQLMIERMIVDINKQLIYGKIFRVNLMSQILLQNTRSYKTLILKSRYEIK